MTLLRNVMYRAEYNRFHIRIINDTLRDFNLSQSLFTIRLVQRSALQEVQSYVVCDSKRDAFRHQVLSSSDLMASCHSLESPLSPLEVRLTCRPTRER